MGRVNTRKTRRSTGKRTARATGSPQQGTNAASPAPSRLSPAAVTGASSGIVSPWGRVDEEYALIKADLKRLAWVTGFLLALLVALTFVLR
ncbi:MAG: hypothetical protein RMK01_08270 [Thermomicrobium sp.]|nr:hypothetical protein [Thermomicrobium sp.]